MSYPAHPFFGIALSDQRFYVSCFIFLFSFWLALSFVSAVFPWCLLCYLVRLFVLFFLVDGGCFWPYFFRFFSSGWVFFCASVLLCRTSFLAFFRVSARYFALAFCCALLYSGDVGYLVFVFLVFWVAFVVFFEFGVALGRWVLRMFICPMVLCCFCVCLACWLFMWRIGGLLLPFGLGFLVFLVGSRMLMRLLHLSQGIVSAYLTLLFHLRSFCLCRAGAWYVFLRLLFFFFLVRPWFAYPRAPLP